MKLTKEIINEKVEQLRKELLDMVEPKFEVGKWYKHNEKSIICFQGYGNDAYGFNLFGNWTTIFNGAKAVWIDGSVILATPSEVQAALEAEAVKRGFKEGVELNYTWYPENKHTCSPRFKGKTEFIEHQNRLLYKGVTVFNSGLWATIIPHEKTIKDLFKEWNLRYEYNFVDYCEKNYTFKITKK